MHGSVPVRKHCAKIEINVRSKWHRATCGPTSEFIAARLCLDHNEFNAQLQTQFAKIVANHPAPANFDGATTLACPLHLLAEFA